MSRCLHGANQRLAGDRRSAVVVVLLLADGLHASPAQRAPVLTLALAVARHAEEFSAILGVRKLSDGRMLLSDSRERRVVVLDLARGTVLPVGRTGDGPKEHRGVASRFASPADSTAMPIDWGGNLFLVAGDHTAGKLLAAQAFGSTRSAIVCGYAADGTALLLVREGAAAEELGKDSLEVVLHDRRSHKEIEIGRARSPYGAPPGRPANVASSKGAPGARAYDPRNAGPGPAGLFLMDRATIFPDGWVAIARLQPYRVDWRAPNGAITVGAPIEPVQPYSDRDKQAHLDEEAAKTGIPVRKLENVWAWSDYLPAFEWRDAPLFAAPEGKLWIARKVTADAHGNRYDVVNRQGKRAGVLTLPPAQRLVGFGRRFVYIAVTDEDGIQHLQRHPRP